MSECPHTDNADKCTCEPGCGCPGYELPMTAREKVADAIRANRGWKPKEGVSYTEQLADAAIAAHLEHLAETGHAVIKLPEPSYEDDPEGNLEHGYGYNGDVRLSDHGLYVHDGRVFDQYDGWSPKDARTIGSWWLAAAAKAEASDE